jgi:hypothetical protein
MSKGKAAKVRSFISPLQVTSRKMGKEEREHLRLSERFMSALLDHNSKEMGQK